MEFPENLNENQRKAVNYSEGPMLILAGAGSGKTRVLTYKIANLILKGLAKQGEILAVTFTNKAAGEMKERIEKILPGVKFPFIGTFHSIAAKFLRMNLEEENHGLNRNFVIYDEGDSRAVIKECLKELNLDEKLYSPGKVRSIIGRLKNKLMDSDSYSRKCFDYESRTIGDLYVLYEKKMKLYNAMDFDDLIFRMVELLRNDEKILEAYSKKFKYILVDEYQDINFSQYTLTILLASANRNITVVGDDDQCIYGFRGAEMSLLHNFENDFPEAVTVKLEQNYRSTEIILKAANHLMKNNKVRKEKNLWTERLEGEQIGYYRSSDGRSEAQFVISKIKEYVRAGKYNYKDFAILYRTNAQSRLFEETLIQEGIPYNLVGSLKFYERKEIKDLLAYLRIIANPNDEISLRRIINVPVRGIGDVTIKKIEAESRKEGISFFESAKRFCKNGKNASKKGIAGLDSFVNLIEEARACVREMQGSSILEMIIDGTGFRAYLIGEGKAEGIAREENINELLNVIKEYESFAEDKSLGAFLSQVSLVSDIDCWNESEGRINLMTLHLTKGLEFPVVFMTGLEEKLMPHFMSISSEAEVEEERRLCYVGMTRAKDILFFTHSDLRFDRGLREERLASRFLKEIPENFYKTANVALKKRQFPSQSRSLSHSEEKPPEKKGEDLFPGDTVMHNVFGRGKVKSVDKDIIKVEFEIRGLKTLVKDFLKKEKNTETTNEKQLSLKKGDRVEHSEWARGMICSIDYSTETALVIFAKFGTKQVRISELVLVQCNVGERIPL